MKLSLGDFSRSKDAIPGDDPSPKIQDFLMTQLDIMSRDLVFKGPVFLSNKDDNCFWGKKNLKCSISPLH